MKTLYDASDTRPLQYALTASITSLKESMILDTPHFLFMMERPVRKTGRKNTEYSIPQNPVLNNSYI